ncbi:integral membrane protein-like protein [Westerdykella ornata]|uniref:Integral membrane protein-like protein n=1 Tax=Westerdykella ornata TaxID=318751 RepID=A0A6A6JJW7_WESOR|nr:integral membrane protein-like protein [Westerdykella ornata]KAF2275986.1 integral membrane protein-like protein [Westerdykella ornata]
MDEVSSTLPQIPPHIHPWLRAVVALGFLSFIASVTLLVLLAYRLIQWRIKSKRSNQFVILIFNLLWADIQQSLAFLLNVEWLRLDSVVVENPICFAQGWLVSTGDLASGVWCFLIGLHTFASVILDYRLKPRTFFVAIVAMWVFIYGVSVIPVAMFEEESYVRSGVWCWIHHDLKDLRLWTHYVWIFIFEFGNVIVYAIIYTILLQRVRSGAYTPSEAKHAKAISNLMVVYPIVYVVCTLPLASARMAAMSNKPPSLARLCLSGAMITSNGWLDVLLYTLTRRIMIFSDEPPADDNGIDTFSAFWSASGKRFGAACTIEAGGAPVVLKGDSAPSSRSHAHGGRRSRSRSHHWRQAAGRGLISLSSSKNESADDLCKNPSSSSASAGHFEMGDRDIKLVTTTYVHSEPAAPEDVEEMEKEARRNRPRTPVGRWSEESAGGKELEMQLARMG